MKIKKNKQTVVVRVTPTLNEHLYEWGTGPSALNELFYVTLAKTAVWDHLIISILKIKLK